jgi:putative flippase GtrA
MSAGMQQLTNIRTHLAPLAAIIAKFGTVGLAGAVVDLGLFNLLRYAGPAGEGILIDQPLAAKALSVLAATLVTFTGHLLWTFQHRSANRRPIASGYALFFLFNAIGLSIALACLWISHYGLGLTSPLADNISANVIGLGLGTIFRFTAYNKWVFRA